MGELSSCNRDHLAHKVRKMDYLALDSRKGLLNLARETSEMNYHELRKVTRWTLASLLHDFLYVEMKSVFLNYFLNLGVEAGGEVGGNPETQLQKQAVIMNT